MKKNICPCCGKLVSYNTLVPENPDEYLTEISPMWISRYKCNSCNHVMLKNNMVDENEYINIKRTKLIDEIIK